MRWVKILCRRFIFACPFATVMLVTTSFGHNYGDKLVACRKEVKFIFKGLRASKFRTSDRVGHPHKSRRKFGFRITAKLVGYGNMEVCIKLQPAPLKKMALPYFFAKCASSRKEKKWERPSAFRVGTINISSLWISVNSVTFLVEKFAAGTHLFSFIPELTIQARNDCKKKNKKVKKPVETSWAQNNKGLQRCKISHLKETVPWSMVY